MKCIFAKSILLTSVIFLAACSAQHIKHVKVNVVEEDGSPVAGAEVYVLNVASMQKHEDGIRRKGRTDWDGEYSALMPIREGYLAYGAEKTGYYDTRHQTPDGKYSEPLKVVLRKIVNPVPMYARDSVRSKNIELPVVGKEVGFDLIEYDWVKPFGSGTHVDMYFMIERIYFESRKNYEAKFSIRFPDPQAGIQIYSEEISRHGSSYPLSRLAPLDGYNSAIEFFRKVEPPNSYGGGLRITRKPDFIAKDINYIFRTRTVVKDGELVKAMYGKIHGYVNFEIPWSPTAVVNMKYYLNPDHTRNLEFDPNQNLFKYLPDREQVGIK
jgi:hypothetical protein